MIRMNSTRRPEIGRVALIKMLLLVVIMVFLGFLGNFGRESGNDLRIRPMDTNDSIGSPEVSPRSSCF